jgi:hypothetical protein
LARNFLLFFFPPSPNSHGCWETQIPSKNSHKPGGAVHTRINSELSLNKERKIKKIPIKKIWEFFLQNVGKFLGKFQQLIAPKLLEKYSLRETHLGKFHEFDNYCGAGRVPKMNPIFIIF